MPTTSSQHSQTQWPNCWVFSSGAIALSFTFQWSKSRAVHPNSILSGYARGLLAKPGVLCVSYRDQPKLDDSSWTNLFLTPCNYTQDGDYNSHFFQISQTWWAALIEEAQNTRNHHLRTNFSLISHSQTVNSQQEVIPNLSALEEGQMPAKRSPGSLGEIQSFLW